MEILSTGYNISFELTALCFLLVIVCHYFNKRRFPNTQNRIFCIVMILSLFNITLDIVTAYTDYYATSLPAFITVGTYLLFYSLQIAVSSTLVLYALSIAKHLKRKYCVLIAAVLAPAGILLVLLFSTPVTGLFFTVDSVNGLVRHPWYFSLYICAAFYLIATALIVIWLRSRYTRSQFYTMLAFIVASLAGTVIQYFFPSLLLTGFVIALSITMMYFTIQNPGDMLDTLTGAFNRDALTQLLSDLIEGRKSYYILVLDVDDMHRINDLFGMPVGNEVLCCISQYLVNIAGRGWVFRLLGDSFAVVFTDVKDYDNTLAQLTQRFNSLWKLSNMDIKLSTTICAVNDTKSAANAGEVFRLIESTLPDAQRRRRGGITNISTNTMVVVKRGVLIERELREALETDGFNLNFQPIFSLHENRFTCAEALLRFESPRLGTISPFEFIPIAEKNGLITRIDEIVLRNVCRFIASCNPKETLGIDTIEVNLSAVDLLQNDLHIMLMDVINSYSIDNSIISFEITESAAAGASARAMDCLQYLRDRGIRIMLDDFGTGYSNIASISHLPLHAVKIDKSMLVAYANSSQSAIVFDDTVRMCKRLGFQTVLEGIETAAQAQIAMNAGVDFIQGYYYAMPMSGDAFINFLSMKNPEIE